MGGTKDEAARIFQKDAKDRGQSIREYGAEHGIDPALIADGKLRRALEGERADHEKQVDPEWARRAPSLDDSLGRGSWTRVQRAADIASRQKDQGPPRRRRSENLTLASAWRFCLAVWDNGGVERWANAAGEPDIKWARRHYRRCRAYVLDILRVTRPDLYAVALAAFPVPQRGRPSVNRHTGRNQVDGESATPPGALPDLTSSEMVPTDASEDDDLLPEPRTRSSRRARANVRRASDPARRVPPHGRGGSHRSRKDRDAAHPPRRHAHAATDGPRHD